MKNTILFLAAMLVLFTGCNKYDDDISRIDKILEQLTHGSITSIEQQVQNISASVSDLQKVDAELKDLIASLESGGNEQATFLAELKAKDAELEKTIVALQAYVDGGMDDMEGWANATFATLEQYADVQMWIEALKVAISNLNKWNDETDQLIGMLVEDLLAAIKASETSMKAWVNGVLADGYYDIAEIDAQLNALETQLTTADADLKKQIADQKAALEKAKTDLTAAYKKAIDDAITTNNGIINKAIADAVQDALDKVDAKLAAIDNVIAAIQKDIEAIKSSINSIDQQIAAINGSIDNLKEVDAQLDGYIKSLQTTAADLQSQIDATNTALAALESDLEGQISASEQKVLNELNTVKTDLEDQLATINNTIAALKAKDAELEQRYFDLEQYINDEIAYTEEWASFTFSTLEQYEATQTAISEINALIKSTQESIAALEERLNKKIADDIAAAVAGVNADIAAKVTEITDGYTAAIATAKEDITAAYTDAIKTAITASETSMKEWVNNVLAEGYYTKAEIDGKITALQTQVAEGDAALQKEIDDLEAALAKAESDLTAAYKKAIEDAINDNNGKITEQIAAAVATAQDYLQAQIDTINGKISGIESRLADVESKIDALIDQIQSVTFIPQYSDGKVELDYSTRATSLDFMINPQRLSIALVSAWENNKGTENSIIKAYVRYTDDPTTRAGNTPTELAVSAVTASEGGMINIIVKDNDPSLLIEDFWNGNKEAVIYIVITNGITEIASEAIPMIAHNYAGNTNTIGGFGDGDTQSGEAGQ